MELSNVPIEFAATFSLKSSFDQVFQLQTVPAVNGRDIMPLAAQSSFSHDEREAQSRLCGVFRDNHACGEATKSVGKSSTAHSS